MKYCVLVRSGVYGDGWTEREASVLLAPGPAAKLVLRAKPVACAGQHLDILLDGELLRSQPVDCDTLDLHLPIPSSEVSRRVDLRWAKVLPISDDDPRLAAALLEHLDIVPLRSPTALRVPEHLGIPGVQHSGIDVDGWVGHNAHVVLAGGPKAELAIHADVANASDQHLTVVVDGVVALSDDVAPGPLHRRIPIAESESERHVELRWAAVTRLPDPDGRHVSSLLGFVGIASEEPPSALRRFPRDLLTAGVSTSGVYRDGWIERTSSVILRGGDSSFLTIRADALEIPDQRLEVRVNDRCIWDGEIRGGPFAVVEPLEQATDIRRVELRWASALPLSAVDQRSVAAQLHFIGVGHAKTPSSVTGDALESGGAAYSGIYDDGWMLPNAWVALSGGEAGGLVLRTFVPGTRATRLTIRVDGDIAFERDVPAGTSDLRVPVVACPGERRIEFAWSVAEELSAIDSRRVSARLEFVGLTGPLGP